MYSEDYWLAFAVAERIISNGPVINFAECAAMLDRAGAHNCAALAREMPRKGFLGEVLRFKFKSQWQKFNQEIEQ